MSARKKFVAPVLTEELSLTSLTLGGRDDENDVPVAISNFPS